MDVVSLPFFIPIIAIIGAFTYAIINSAHRARVRELEIRERIAMIEKGLVPPPEVDPKGFDRAMDRYETRNWTAGASRHRRAGITLMGVGFGLMTLITFAGDELRVGIGVGGFLVVLGLAFFINSLFEPKQPVPFPPGSSANSTPATPQRHE